MRFVSNLTWILVALSILGNVFVIYDRKTMGYVIWLVANAGWIVYNIYIAEYSQMSLFIVYSFLAMLGISVECRKKSSVPMVQNRLDRNQEIQAVQEVQDEKI